jgi:hypothetical protein
MRSWFAKLADVFSFLTTKRSLKRLEPGSGEAEGEVRWWGEFVLEEEQSRYFKIGNIVLCFDRYNHEWYVTYRSNDYFGDEHPEAKTVIPFKSFAALGSNEIALTPVLPDRSFFTELEKPHYIPPRQTLSFIISSPLWIKTEIGKPSMLLDEIPTEILSDTWVGRNTLEGELCYGGKTPYSARLEELPENSTRVFSAVTVVNHSKNTLVFKELKIPLPFLSVYSDNQNRLWTESLRIEQENAEASPEVLITKAPPRWLEGVELISSPRMSLKQGFKNLFSPFMWK